MDKKAAEALRASAGHLVSLEKRIARLEAELHGLKPIMKTAPQHPSLLPSTSTRLRARSGGRLCAQLFRAWPCTPSLARRAWPLTEQVLHQFL